MTLVTIILYAILVLIPILTLVQGIRFKKCASAPGAKEGFEADYIPRTPEAWHYMQELAGKCYIAFSILMLVCGVGFMLLMPCADLVSLLCCTGIALGLEVVVLLICMTIIGMTLQNHFKQAST